MTKPEENNKVHAISRADEIDEGVRYIRMSDVRDDEISLIDLVNVFVKRKMLFLSVMMLVTFLGLLYALSKPVVYSYFVSVEIGRSGGGLVESVDTLFNKINKHYIPVNTNKFMEQYSDKRGLPSIMVSKEKESNMIFLETKGMLDDQSIHFEFINSLVNDIISDHQRLSSVYRKELELSSEQVNNAIKRLKDEEQLLISQKARMKDKESFLRKRILLIQKSLAGRELNRAEP